MCHDKSCARARSEHASFWTDEEGTADHGVENGVQGRRLVTFTICRLSISVYPSLLSIGQFETKNMADAVEEIERDGGNRAVKDLFAGAVGGVAQVLIGE